MNRIVPILIFVFLSSAIYSEEKKDSVLRKNEVSLVVSELINGALHVRYERKISRNMSFGLGTAIKGEEGLIHLSGLQSKQLETSDLTYTGFKLVPEFRYYLKKTQQYEMDGFYFGAYMKYSRYVSQLFGTYTDDLGQDYRIDSRANLDILTMGFAIGYKLALNKRWNFDFIIAGPGAGSHRYTVKNKFDMPDSFYEDLTEALEKYSLYDLINSDFKTDLERARAKFIFPAFRYGFSIGYTFSYD